MPGSELGQQKLKVSQNLTPDPAIQQKKQRHNQYETTSPIRFDLPLPR